MKKIIFGLLVLFSFSVMAQGMLVSSPIEEVSSVILRDGGQRFDQLTTGSLDSRVKARDKLYKEYNLNPDVNYLAIKTDLQDSLLSCVSFIFIDDLKNIRRGNDKDLRDIEVNYKREAVTYLIPDNKSNDIRKIYWSQVCHGNSYPKSQKEQLNQFNEMKESLQISVMNLNQIEKIEPEFPAYFPNNLAGSFEF